MFFSLKIYPLGICGDFDNEIDSRSYSAFPTPFQATVCRLHTIQRVGCALISDVVLCIVGDTSVRLKFNGGMKEDPAE